MTLQVVGALCVVAAVVGDKLKISEVEIQALSRVRSLALLLVGAMFIGLGLLTG